MNIEIDNRQTLYSIDCHTLSHIAERILTCMQAPAHSELSIVLVNDLEIQHLNREYRGLDRSTDVLAFAQQETVADQQVPLHIEQTAFPVLLGDVILSVETAARQAGEQGFDQELYVLLTHGILHLLGYDHQTDEEAGVMEGLEQQILQTILREISFFC